MFHNKMVHMVTFLLLVVGGINWLLVGLLDYNLVSMILGPVSDMAVRVVYILVGLSAVYELLGHRSTCKMCDSGAAQM